ncbi:MAG: thioesterase family protein [Pseudomonadota bacterium]
MTELKEYWRGGVEASDCDAMGHMSVGNWLRRYWDGVAVLAVELGMPTAFSANAEVTLQLKSCHMHWLREANAGTPIFMRGGILSLSETGLQFYGEFVKTISEEVAANFCAQIILIDNKTSKTLPWPKKSLENLDCPKIEIPKHGRPRSIDALSPIEKRDKNWVNNQGYVRIGLAPVTKNDVDCHGRFLPQLFIARVGEAIPNLIAKWRLEAIEETSENGAKQRLGGAALENRTEVFEYPQIGDIIEIYSALREVADKTYSFQHWLINGQNGRPFSVSNVVVITFDLDTRKAITIPPKARQYLESMVIKPQH